jgi:hypothetical protein
MLKRFALGRKVAAEISSFVAAATWCAVALPACAQAPVSAYDVESAYLFNFGKFVRYAHAEPETVRQSFDICIVGEDPLGATLDELTAHERLDGKPVRVLRLKAAADARNCAIAYISASEGGHIESDLDALHGQPVLTVSDAPDFLKRGGMIQLIVAGHHVRFAVNLGAVERARLSLSSELLRVATSVNGEPPEGVRP